MPIMNGMMMQGPSMPRRPGEVIANTFWGSVSDAVSVTADFAGMDTGADHLQLAAGVVGGTTDRMLLPGRPNHKIVVNEVSVSQAGGAPGYVGTLAQEGETSDIIQFVAGQYGQARFEAIFELEVGKGLMLYRAQGIAGTVNDDVNVVTVFYSYVESE
tara:strand:+ start:5067 stop:5540 length:474 start_codon:yes stop_codon:yes gene_type:complete